MGLKEAADYTIELKKAEKAKEVRSRVGSGRPGTTIYFQSAEQLALFCSFNKINVFACHRIPTKHW